MPHALHLSTCTVSLLLLLSSALCHASANQDSTYHDYCVIGAGPGGLQTAYFLQRSGRDYVVFERSDTAGNFFTTYPRHRKLISINKRFTGQRSPEFNLRHDWNSLLSDDPDLLMTKYSNLMFPDADVLVKYLQDYQTKLGLRVQYNTNIGGISTRPNATAPDGHVFVMHDQRGEQYVCRTMIMATGMHKPNIPSIQGIENTVGYEEMSLNPVDYEGKTVLILGRGNTAFEIATSIYGSTNMIHMVARSRVRLAFQTHYVGDLRAINNELLDTYQLKSLDGLMESDLDDLVVTKFGDKIMIKSVNDSYTPDRFDNGGLRYPYDVVIRALGFTFDDSVFNVTSISRPPHRASKYPAIRHTYESVDQSGLFYAGTASHSLDFRKSSGGFIHGFRYTARVLARLLEYRYHGVPWPSVTIPTSQLLNTITKRVNDASGPYQMFEMLGDVALFSEDQQTVTYLEEFPVNLLHHVTNHTGHVTSSVLVIVQEYGKDFSGPGKDVFRSERSVGEPSEAHSSNFLHPVMYYYKRLPAEHQMATKGKWTLPRPDSMHHVVEDFYAEFKAQHSHILPLRRFLEHITNSDLRGYFAESCLTLALTHDTLPESCQASFMEGRGIPAKRPEVKNVLPNVDINTVL